MRGFFNDCSSLKGFRVAGYLFLFKITYFALLSGALLLWRTPENDTSIVFVSARHASDESLTFGSHFLSFDADCYLFLSENGYRRGFKECAFYPLYPLLIRWVSTSIDGSDELVGIVMANLFSFAAFLLFFQMVARRHGEQAATLATMILLVFPGSLFFQFIYTESLFFLLLMLFCLALEREYFVLGLVTAFLLPLTRAVGIFCLFVLVWHLLVRLAKTPRMNRDAQLGWASRAKWFIELCNGNSPLLNFRSRPRAGAFCLALAPLLGWATYFFLMWKWTGNAFEGIDAQKYYGVQSVHKLFEPVQFVTQLVSPTVWHNFKGSLLDRCVFILLIYCFPMIWRLDRGWCIWAFFLGVVPAMSGVFTSYTRFASVVFPLFVVLGMCLCKPELRWFRWFTLAVFVTLHVVLVWRFVNFEWAG